MIAVIRVLYIFNNSSFFQDRYEDDRQQYQNITKSNTQLNCSSATSLNHSNNDLNQVCHHTKPSSKPRGGRFHLV